MEDLSDEALYRAIGEAVVSSQLFERFFVVTVRFAVMQANVTNFTDIKTVEAAKAFKQPTMALLKQISGSVEIESVEDRVTQLVEDRHRVVHRLVDEFPWPGPASDEHRFELLRLCETVKLESLAISGALRPVIEGWVKRFPEIDFA
ncbi:hypothetical protein [Pseudomonas sp. MYb118]|uniref:hypothetical protein n=1 Tax=Pseudomonas sp. MYb118 TaxID=1848720 RepID=UPI0034CE9A0A